MFLGVLQTFIEGFCHGNLTKEEARTISNTFKTYLVKKELPREYRYHDRIAELPSESAFLYRTKVKNDSEENSVVEVILPPLLVCTHLSGDGQSFDSSVYCQVYFQAEQDFGRKSIRARALVDLFEQIAHEPCFDQLR